MENQIKKRRAINISITVILSVICFATGFLLHNTVDVSSQKELEPFTVDFKANTESNDSYGRDFTAAVSLFYLFQKENIKGVPYSNYFDTLSIMKDKLLYLEMKDTNFLILYQPEINTSYKTSSLYGFTKDKFLIYTPKSLVLKNFPKEFVHR